MPTATPTDATWLAEALRAVSNPHRLNILIWLTRPHEHFPAQRDGDLEADGVCVSFIADKTGLSQPTVTSHMQILAGAGLVSSTKIKNWVYYRPDRDAVERLLQEMGQALLPQG